MKQKSKLAVASIILLIFVGSFLFVPSADAALVNCGQNDPDPATQKLLECKISDLLIILIKIINTLLGLSWLLAVFFVFWTSWGIVFAWGSPEEIKKNKEGLRQALFGFFFIMVAFILINFVVYSLAGFNLGPKGSPNSIFQLFPI